MTPIASDTSFETDFGFVCILPTWQTVVEIEKEGTLQRGWGLFEEWKLSDSFKATFKTSSLCILNLKERTQC